MALEIGRQGYLGLALEATAGTAESTPSVFVPFTENSLMDMHEPLTDISSRASRALNADAITGKRWGEGSIAAYADATNLGYFLKLALGNETKTVVGGTPEVNDHQFYPTTSGNTPKSATLWNYRGDTPAVKQYRFSCVDTLDFEVANEDIATVSVSVIGDYPTKVTAPSLTTTSGTLLTWKDMTVKFGDTVADAVAATATKLTNFKFSIANNLEAHYRSGNNEPDTFTCNEFEVTGEYTLFLEDDVELDKYRDLTKKVMVIDLTGANIGGGYTERVRIVCHNIFIEENDIPSDLEGVWALTQNFRVINKPNVSVGGIDVTVRNLKATTY